MMKYPALEKNILKFRAFEMILFLFQAEDLKRYIIESIRCTYAKKIPMGSKNILTKALQILVDDGILTLNETDDLKNLFDYRNTIAHQIHLLTGDIVSKKSQKSVLLQKCNYNYEALDKIVLLKNIIERGFAPTYDQSLSLDPVLFESAQKTFENELNKLRKKINRQYLQRQASLKKTKLQSI